MTREKIPEGWSVPDKAAGRSADDVARLLERWMRARIAGAARIKVTNVSWPIGAGVSNETILFSASWLQDGEAQNRDLVLRISPAGFQLYKDANFDLQFKLLQALHNDGRVSVAEPLWYEDDPNFFGQAFFVMSRLRGRVPVSYPPYNSTGWLFDAKPEERAHLWRSAMRQLANVHQTPASAVVFLEKPALGATGFDQLWRYWLESYDWARDGRDYPVFEAAREWLITNMPAQRPTALSWGDSRIGNMMFDETFDVTGVMDWEQASLGGPMHDIGWWTFFDMLHSSSMGLKRLDGLGSISETLSLWEDLTSYKVTDLRWHQVFSGFKVATIVMKRLQITHELKPGYNVNNNVWTRLMAELHGGTAPIDFL